MASFDSKFDFTKRATEASYFEIMFFNQFEEQGGCKNVKDSPFVNKVFADLNEFFKDMKFFEVGEANVFYDNDDDFVNDSDTKDNEFYLVHRMSGEVEAFTINKDDYINAEENLPDCIWNEEYEGDEDPDDFYKKYTLTVLFFIAKNGDRYVSMYFNNKLTVQLMHFKQD